MRPRHWTDDEVVSSFGRTFVKAPRGFKDLDSGISTVFIVCQARPDSIRIERVDSLETAHRLRGAWHAGQYHRRPGELRYFNQQRESHENAPTLCGALAV